jgi:hypothetical protein
MPVTLQTIETHVSVYAARRDRLAAELGVLNNEIERLKAEHLPRLRTLANDTAAAKLLLRGALEAAPEIFAKPRTRIIHGVKVGYTKQKGKVAIDDEAAVIKRIRKLLPVDQAELLIRVREHVHKPGCYDLTAADLKRLGIRVAEDEDAVVIKPTDGEIDKLVDTLLDDAGDVEEAAA